MGAHGHTSHPVRPAACTPRWLLAVLSLAVVAVGVGLVTLWPHGPSRSTAQGSTFVHGTVESLTTAPCGDGRCEDVVVRLTDGPDAGGTTTLNFPLGVSGNPDLSPGLDIRLQRGDPAQSGGRVVYAFDDVQRGKPLLLLAAAFAVLVTVVARWRGLAAVAGLGASLVVVLAFLLPALLEGRSPLLVGLVGAGAIALAFSRLTGLSSDEVSTLQALGNPVSVGGLVLCGAIVGAVGVLNDVTVSQASAVEELGATAPRPSRRALFAAGMRVARDHIASTVYTLGLAYVGSALPVLLLLTTSGRSGLDSLTGDAVAGEIVAGLAGGVGLVLAVPITTALAAAAVAGAARTLEAAPSAPRPDVGHRHRA